MTQFNLIKEFVLYPRFGAGHLLHWVVDPAQDLGSNYNFTVEVSNDPTFVGEPVYTIDAGTAFAVIDDSNDKQSWSYDRYYRLKITRDSVVEYSRAIIFGVQPVLQRQYSVAAEIIRKELLRMRRFTGQDGWLLKRKVTGATSRFVDEVSGVSMADSTEEFNTGLEGGYYPPIAMWYTYEAFEQRKAFAQGGFGVDDDITVKFRTIGFPLVEVRDIIVNKDTDSRYNVLAVDAFSYPGTNITIVQTITVKRLPPTDTIYQIATPTTHEFIIP